MKCPWCEQEIQPTDIVYMTGAFVRYRFFDIHGKLVMRIVQVNEDETSPGVYTHYQCRNVLTEEFVASVLGEEVGA